MSNKLAWGIISTGGIAHTFAKGLAQTDTGYALAVGSRNQESADAFADEFGIERRYASYEALLSDPDIQAVYIATPHPMHAEWAVKAAQHGKHILLEKPATVNFPETMAILEAVKANNVFFMEAFMYRCHPQTAKIVELIREGAIGKVRIINAAFSFQAKYEPERRWLNPALGGGGILDIGCYCMSMARLIAGTAMGKTFADPVSIKAFGHVGELGCDEYTSAVMLFDDNIIANISCGIQLNQENAVRIFGSEGNIYIPEPWWCGSTAGECKITLTKYSDPEPQIITMDSGKSMFGMEADEVAKSLSEGKLYSDKNSPEDTLSNMKALDRWRIEIGMIYEQEKPNAFYPAIMNRPLAVKPDFKMTYGSVEGLDKKVSRLGMGVMLDGAEIVLPHMSIMFDSFFEAGGNAFDTAHIYGQADTILGQWMANRGVRKDTVVIGKGAHTPNCNPASLTIQLFETLDNMQTDYIDMYFMHRDNEDIPVGEFVDVLNEHRAAGRIKAFGGSNWSLKRVEAANAYAKSKGLAGFSAVSNNFSLAEMMNPVWDGCIRASDPESMAWFTKTQLPLFAWSSQSRGFFTRATPEDRSEESLVHCWYSDDNFRRLERAKELAAKKGVEPINIAVAYVLCQPFPTIALIGPRSITEWNSSSKALGVELTPEELKWLNLEI